MPEHEMKTIFEAPDVAVDNIMMKVGLGPKGLCFMVETVDDGDLEFVDLHEDGVRKLYDALGAWLEGKEPQR